ncbi:hypothetical protein [Umezawaea sp. NPDC059074]|uniref:hypothetical protein n=1 Tax=Umezawaea sp. NPDC059074 TaxID=3346716 RepID=UPI003692969A
MSQSPPRHHNHPGRRAAAPTTALITFLVLLLSACEPGTTPSPLDPAAVPVEVQDAPRASDMDVEFSAMCDDTGFAYDVEPDTAEAQEAARRFCRNADTAIDSADWPAGLRPLGDVAVDK